MEASSSSSGGTDATGTGGSGATDSDSGDAPGVDLSGWESCFTGMQCARLTVPVDHDDPTLGDVVLDVIMKPSLHPRGTIAFLAGGPGNSSFDIVSVQGNLFSGALAEWNIVAIDHRGVGHSDPKIVCGDDASWDALRLLDASPDDAAEDAALDAAAAAWSSACASETPPELLGRMDSATAARDLDLLRRALGEELLYAFATSYGTIMAREYAQRFPEHTGGLVLDSPVLAAHDARESYRLQASAYEAALDAFFAWCSGEVSCAFHGGEEPAAIGAAFDAAWASADATLNPGMRADEAVLSTLAAGNRTDLAEGLAALEAGSAAELVALASDPPVGDDGKYTNYIPAWMGVLNADRVWPDGFTRADLRALEQEFAADAPRLASILLARRWFVGHWTTRSVHPPTEIGASIAPPYLMIAGEEDVAAPLSQAETIRDTADNGSHLVTVAGPGHGQLLRAVGCLVPIITAYLDDPAAPPIVTRCE